MTDKKFSKYITKQMIFKKKIKKKVFFFFPMHLWHVCMNILEVSDMEMSVGFGEFMQLTSCKD